MRSPMFRRASLGALVLVLVSGLVLSSCGGVAACVGWWCVGVGPCYPYCPLSVSTAYGDFDGDGNPDSASGTPGQTMIILRRGTPDNSFGEGTTFMASTGTSADFVRAGNFTADTNLDLAVVDVATGQVRTHIGDGTGAFPTEGTPLALPSLSPLRAVRVARVNGDAFDDLVLFDFDGGILVLLANGTGGWSVGAAGRVAFGNGAVALGIGLLDGDGLVDVVILDAVAGTLSAYTGDGSGAWTMSAGPFPIPSVPTAAAIGEFNGMPGLDLALVAGVQPSLHVYFGANDGSLTASPQGPVPLPLPSVSLLRVVPSASAPAGPADLVAAGGRALVGIPNLGDGTFGTPGQPNQVQPIKDIEPIDLNGDAFTDLLITYEGTSAVGIGLGGTRQR